MLQYALPPQARFHIESPGRRDQVLRISIQRLLGGDGGGSRPARSQRIGSWPRWFCPAIRFVYQKPLPRAACGILETVDGHWNGFFDAHSRPLARFLRYAESMLGLVLIPIEYRTVDECPTFILGLGGRSRSGSRSTIHIDEIHQNVRWTMRSSGNRL